MQPEDVTASAMPGVTNMKSMRLDPWMCEGGKDPLLCCLASGSIRLQEETIVAKVSLCCFSMVGTPSYIEAGVWFPWCQDHRHDWHPLPV